MLSHGDILPLSVVLGTIAHLFESFRYVTTDIVTADLHPASRRCLLGDDDLHGRGLAGAVVTQQTQNLARLNRQREIPYGDLRRFLLGLVAFRTAAAGCYLLALPIFFSQILHSDVLHNVTSEEHIAHFPIANSSL